MLSVACTRDTSHTLIVEAAVSERREHLRQPGAIVPQLGSRRDGHELDAVALPLLVTEPGLQLSQHAPHHADHFGQIRLCREKHIGQVVVIVTSPQSSERNKTCLHSTDRDICEQLLRLTRLGRASTPAH